jgi:hypothetical protein
VAEVTLSTEDLVVLGGPSQIELQLDSGAQGQRGTFIMYGFENPNTPEASAIFISPPQVFDFYVVVDPGSEDYLQLFQYVNRDGELLWVPAVKLSINIFSTTIPALFIEGLATIELSVADLGLASISESGSVQSIDVNFFTQPGSSAYFNLQMSISNFNPEYTLDPEGGSTLDLYPVMSTYVVSDIYLDENDNLLKLPVTISAVELTPDGFTPVNDKTMFVQILTTLQSPDLIRNYIASLSGGQS